MYKCNFCGKELNHICIDLDHQPPSNNFLTEEQLLLPEIYYSLRAYVCSDCWLVQIPEIKKADDIFTNQYPYYSSQSPSNVSHAKELVEIIMERFSPKSVIEVGSNDGYLLQHFPKSVFTLGFDPATGPASVANNKGIITKPDFFSPSSAAELKADLICSINTIAHQPNINEFAETIKNTLSPNGVTIHEFPHLLKTINGLQFDQFYLEHYSYFSFATICTIFQKHGLEVFDVDELPEHGGSLRIYTQHELKHQERSDKVAELLKQEQVAGMFTLDYCSDFQSKINEIKVNLMEFLYDVKYAEGATVVAYGAAAKANTFMNYCGIKSDLIDCVVDRSIHKQGLYCPGSHIPVVNEEDGIINMKPDYVLITAWNLRDEIMEQLKYIREWNGKFIIALPKLEVI
jgi:hypothetical protein